MGKGLVGGAVGAAAMTISGTIERKRRDRKAGSALAETAVKVLRMEPHDDERRPSPS